MDDDGRESNVAFRLPYDQVVSMWRDCMGKAYRPDMLYERYRHQVRATYANRLRPDFGPERRSWKNVKRGLTMLARIVWHVGVKADYRREFWRFARERLRERDIETLIAVALTAHHLIVYAREASQGRQNASHYSARVREPALASR